VECRAGIAPLTAVQRRIPAVSCCDVIPAFQRLRALSAKKMSAEVRARDHPVKCLISANLERPCSNNNSAEGTRRVRHWDNQWKGSMRCISCLHAMLFGLQPGLGFWGEGDDCIPRTYQLLCNTRCAHQRGRLTCRILASLVPLCQVCQRFPPVDHICTSAWPMWIRMANPTRRMTSRTYMVSALFVLKDNSAILPASGPSASSKGVVVGHFASPTSLLHQYSP
jgi:hypothetical protein